MICEKPIYITYLLFF